MQIRFLAAGSIILAFVVSACGGARYAPASIQTLRNENARPTSSSGKALPSRLVFVGDWRTDLVDIFDAKSHKQIGDVSGFSFGDPMDVATDSVGDLLVADDYRRIDVYSPPYTEKPQAISDGNYYPNGLHVDKAGNIWVANFDAVGQARGDVEEFPAGSHTARKLKGGPYFMLYVATNANGDVWADGSYWGGSYEIGYWKGGQGNFIRANLPVGTPGPLEFDSHGNLLIVDQTGANGNAAIDVFPPGSKKPSRTIVTQTRSAGLALSPDERLIYAPDYGGTINIITYPDGKIIGHLTPNTPGDAVSAAVVPATEP